MSEILKIVHTHFDEPISIDDEVVMVLVEENPNEFYYVVQELMKQINGESGDFVFTINEKIINPEKVGTIISDVFNFDINDKKILNLIYKKLEKSSYDSDIVSQISLVNNQVINYLDTLIFKENFSLEYEEISPIEIFKASSLKIRNDYENLVEKIVSYINLMVELKNCKFFVFVNLKSVINNDELLQIYKHCKLEKVGLLLIESSERSRLKNEKMVIITEDLCEILVNSSS